MDFVEEFERRRRWVIYLTLRCHLVPPRLIGWLFINATEIVLFGTIDKVFEDRVLDDVAYIPDMGVEMAIARAGLCGGWEQSSSRMRTMIV